MINKLLGVICAVVLGVDVCMAQSDGSQNITNWGESVHGVQLSVELNTNVIIAGTWSVLHCRITNASATDSAYFVKEPAHDFDISLIDNSGKNFELMSNPSGNPGSLVVLELKPGKTLERSIPIKVDKSVKPGNYTLKTEASVEITDGAYALDANLLKVQIE